MAAATFHADPRRLAMVSDFIAGAVASGDAPLRVLDIGCGTGDQLFDLADRLPAAEFTGLDIEASNIEIAEGRRRRSAHHARITLIAGDYRLFRPAAGFDVVFSYSVMQFVPGGTLDLASRIIADVAPSGVFVNVMPYRCGFNRALAAARKGIAAVESPIVDAMALRIARLLHPDVDQALLAERVRYSYMVPLQYEEDLAAQLEDRGLRTIRRQPFPHASVAQLKHAGRIMRR